MKATILTASYNCGPYLKDCIFSVRKQTHQDWEMVIVDDCSKDNSRKILRKFANKDGRIRIVHNKSRLKCGGAYNEGLKHATGEICCVIDADDALSSNTSLARLVRKYEENPGVDFIWTQFNHCDPGLKKIRKGWCGCPPTSFLEAGIQYTKFRHCFSHWRTFRTGLREEGVIFSPGLPAAVDKWMGYALEELGVGGFFGKTLYNYRSRIGGLSYKGRKHWKRMLISFANRRKEEGIQAKPTVVIK